MEKIEKTIEELSLSLMYLTRFEERVGSGTAVWAWKGYPFSAIDSLVEKDYIDTKPRSKSAYLTESGIAKAKELLSKYGINDA